jgi:hypothetical protein
MNLDDAKSKCAGLAQQNGFGPAYLEDCAEASERHSKASKTSREEYK